MPFLCTPRVLNSIATDRTNRVALQITDLFPHKTQSNAVLTPRFKGPAYLYAHGRDLTATPVLNGDNDINADVAGLSAYILLSVPDDINQNGDNNAVALTPANTDLIAGDIIERMETGLSLTLSDINTIIAARAGNAGIGLGLGGATATVLQILQIVSGYKVFSVTAGTSVADGNDAFDGPNANDLTALLSDPTDASKLFTSFDSSFYISARKGQLKVAQTRKDKDGNGIPFVVCYDDNGNLIQ
jgi:hypothetical protein